MFKRLFPEPVAAKVPEITTLFWVVKILTTAGGEATSDWLALGNRMVGGAVETLLCALALAWQLRTRRYHAAAYWSAAYSIAIFGTGVADILHLGFGISYGMSTIFWAVVLAAVFVTWHRSERTLSIHSIVTERRELYYWATVFATFALGTAFGDFTAVSLGLGFLASGIFFTVVILVPAFAWSRLDLNGVVAFWAAYVVTRPLGASFADYFSKAKRVSGLALGNGPTALVITAVTFALVGYLVATRRDIQGADQLAVAMIEP
ncbi:MAG: COG4705 family protein [Acidimicrobiales bacterium]